jgi:phosphoenolpyruvate carboxylase
MSLEKWPWGGVEPKQFEHELFSIAVSLKRIADAMPTQRDRFAAQALAGMAANRGDFEKAIDVASRIFVLADAMMQRRDGKL